MKDRGVKFFLFGNFIIKLNIFIYELIFIVLIDLIILFVKRIFLIYENVCKC